MVLMNDSFLKKKKKKRNEEDEKLKGHLESISYFNRYKVYLYI